MRSRDVRRFAIWSLSCGLLLIGFQNMTTSSGGSNTPATSPMGILKNETSRLDKDSCTDLRDDFGQAANISLNNYFDESQVKAAVVEMTCQQFRDEILKKVIVYSNNHLQERHGDITRSIKLVERCSFPRTHLEIAASNIILDCGNSVFTGGEPSDRVLGSGITFAQNDSDPKVAATTLPVLSNIQIRNCHFENYKSSGVFIANQFNRRNPVDQKFYNDILLPMHRENQFDLLDKPSPADEIRKRSPHQISLYNISVRNTLNAGIYIQNSVNEVDISNAKLMYNRTGIYLDFGTRNVNVRNSCFLKSGFADPRRTAEDVASDRPGREGIAVDASAGNRIVNNLFYRTRTGAVHLYKNCWESYDLYRSDATQMAQFPRRQPSDGNVIDKNVIVEGQIGISVAHRQWGHIKFESSDSEVLVGHCGDRYFDKFIEGQTEYRTYADYARGNKIVGNTFYNTNLPVRLQDDGNQVRRNTFIGNEGNYFALVGKTADTKYRKRSVINNEIIDNISLLMNAGRAEQLVQFRGGSRPYTSVEGNRHNGQAFSVPHTSTEESWCALPVWVDSSNGEGDACRFTQGETLVANGKLLKLSDGGLIHGQIEMKCENGDWKVQTGYCCTGTGCAEKAPRFKKGFLEDL